MGNREPFAIGEWYHCYSRGIDKRIVFGALPDYRRFTELLYLANSEEPVRRDDRAGTSYTDSLTLDRGDSIVSLGAYALMPNHFHIVVYESCERGISRFMQKLITGYSMYYNIRNKRSGGLFTRPFRSQHIGSDTYLQYVVDYVHLNPVEHAKGNGNGIIARAKEYAHSSFALHSGERATERSILGREIFNVYRVKSTATMLESLELYRQSP